MNPGGGTFTGEAMFTILNFLCLFLMNCQRPTSTSLSPLLSIHPSLPLFTHPGYLGVVRAFWDNRQHLDNFLKLTLSEEKKAILLQVIAGTCLILLESPGGTHIKAAQGFYLKTICSHVSCDF